jgi:hypothetical protein
MSERIHAYRLVCIPISHVLQRQESCANTK